jgi:hypothetical protein
LHLAIYWHGDALSNKKHPNKEYAGNKHIDREYTSSDKSHEYLLKAINEGYRDNSWLKTLIRQNLLADSVENQQVLDKVEGLVTQDLAALEKNSTYQQLISQTAKDIISSRSDP